MNIEVIDIIRGDNLSFGGSDLAFSLISVDDNFIVQAAVSRYTWCLTTSLSKIIHMKNTEL